MSDDERIERLKLEVEVLQANNKGLRDKIEELKDKYSDEKIRNTIIKRYREVIEKDYVSKDKIKAKIEDIESQINDIKDNLDYEYNETMVNEVWRLENKIDVLQSLLEKE